MDCKIYLHYYRQKRWCSFWTPPLLSLVNRSIQLVQRKFELHTLFCRKADIFMGLCAPAAVATHTTLEGCAPHDGFAVVPGQFVEVPGVFQLMGCIRQGGEDHAGITLKADARNATGHFGAVYPGAASAFLRIDRAVLGKIFPDIIVPCAHFPPTVRSATVSRGPRPR